MPTNRPAPQTPATLRAIGEELAELSAGFEALAVWVENHGVQSLSVPNNDQRRRGLQYLDNFHKAARAAMRKVREERGDFGTAPKPPRKKK